MDQELLLEQIISYTIGASEMIPEMAERVGQDYQLAILPYGPHFYTGILQSAGYMLLPQRKKLLLLIEQDKNDKEIFQITGTFWPILGQQRTFHQDKKKRNTEFQPSIQDLGNILNNLAYLQTISHTAQISCLAVGSHLSPTKQKTLNAYLASVWSDTNIVFLDNISVPSQTTNVPVSTLVKTNTWATIKTFHTLSKKLKRSSEIIAYAHGDKKNGNGYACILA